MQQQQTERRERQQRSQGTTRLPFSRHALLVGAASHTRAPPFALLLACFVACLLACLLPARARAPLNRKVLPGENPRCCLRQASLSLPLALSSFCSQSQTQRGR